MDIENKDLNEDSNIENDSIDLAVVSDGAGELKLDKVQGKKDYSRLGAAAGAFYFVWNVAVIIASLIVAHVFKVKGSYTVALLISLVFEVLSLSVYFYILKPIQVNKIEKHSLKPSKFFKIIMVMYALSIGGSLVSSFFNSILRNMGLGESVSGITTFASKSYPLMFVYAVILAPVIEELIFRKALIDSIYKYGTKMAIITSGIFFGLIHGNIEQFFYAFLIGVLFAYVYVSTGNIKYTIALHMTMNGVSMLLTFFMTKIDIFSKVLSDDVSNITNEIESMLKSPSQFTYFMLLLLITLIEYGFAIAGLVIIILNAKKIKLPDSGRENISFRLAYVNAGMIFFFAVIIGFFILGYIR